MEWAVFASRRLETENGKSYVGHSIVIDILPMNELTLLRARTRVAADNLSARELEIAQQISDGLDCKTIAQSLAIPPQLSKIIRAIFIRNWILTIKPSSLPN
jgi:hypothetical protein